MENKINVYELLKDCPKGMELDSPVWNNIVFEEIDEDNIVIFRKSVDAKVYLTQYGEVNSIDGNCVIYPKGKTTWEGFVPPCKFKNGDIISNSDYVAIFYKIGTPCRCTSPNVVYYHCYYSQKYCKFKNELDYGIGTFTQFKYATEEEKQKLFDAIKANGYKWNPETKTLEELIVPNFKVDDKIKLKGGDVFGIITQIADCYYTIKCKHNTYCWPIKKQDDWELINELKFKVGDVIANNYRNHLNGDSRSWKIYQITNDKYIFTDGSFIYIQDQNNWVLSTAKFDINTLVPFESKVLCRDNNTEKWKSNFWGFYDNGHAMNYPFECCGTSYGQCIPYEGNEHLLGKKDDCDEYFKNW